MARVVIVLIKSLNNRQYIHTEEKYLFFYFLSIINRLVRIPLLAPIFFLLVIIIVISANLVINLLQFRRYGFLLLWDCFFIGALCRTRRARFSSPCDGRSLAKHYAHTVLHKMVVVLLSAHSVGKGPYPMGLRRGAHLPDIGR